MDKDDEGKLAINCNENNLIKLKIIANKLIFSGANYWQVIVELSASCRELL